LIRQIITGRAGHKSKVDAGVQTIPWTLDADPGFVAYRSA